MKKLILLLLLLLAPLMAREMDRKPQLVVEDWLISARLGTPSRYRNLVLYPVLLPSRGLPDYHTLDQALALGSLVISEATSGGSVNELKVDNRGAEPVFIMAGEILEGAKQDRVLQDDLWLPARSGPVTVAVYCVEHGRWTYQTQNFEKSRPIVANAEVRSAARETHDQGAVWSSVEKTQQKAGYSDSTNLGKTYDDPAIKERLAGYRQALEKFARENPEARGVVVQVGDRLLAVDLFADRTGFVLKFNKLLPSYALEAANEGSNSAQPDSDKALSFLRKTAGSDWTVRDTPGLGRLLQASTLEVSASALVLDQVVVHLESFPHRGVKPARPIEPNVDR